VEGVEMSGGLLRNGYIADGSKGGRPMRATFKILAFVMVFVFTQLVFDIGVQQARAACPPKPPGYYIPGT
jgi:hypothetical protein